MASLTLALTTFCFVSVGSQFRARQPSNYYDQPLLRPTTSRSKPIPDYRNPEYDFNNNNYDQYGTFRHLGKEYRPNEQNRRDRITSLREKERLLRQKFQNEYDDSGRLLYEDSIFKRWRSDLQGEKRPGETPGINLPLAEDVFVSTDSGKLQGFYVYLYDTPGLRDEERPANKPKELQRHLLNVTVFLGIPYAQPPYNEGRFKPPRRVQNWHTTWDAIDYSPACPQDIQYIGASKGIRSGIDEDCLYLNIFTPSLSVNYRERYPVMFYIHGGDFDHGSGSQFPAHLLAAWGEVVVVTVNYRLGALGFLSTGDYHSPGNYGLMDLARAVEWVYNNVRFFNGDRNRITVFGPGAGGAAAGLLAVLPNTRDYVRQVIAESGSPLADWAAIADPYRVQNTSRVFGLEMGCNVENSYNLLRCLIKRDYEELATGHITPDVGTFAWSPVVDQNFTVPEDSWYEEWDEKDWHVIPELPINLFLKNKHHRYLRYMTGANRDEAANFVYNDIRLSSKDYEVTQDFFDKRIREWILRYNYTLNPEGAFDAIKWKYTFWPDPTNKTHIREQYINMLSDALYKSGVDQIVKVLINSTNKHSVPTYYYILNTTVEAKKYPLWREVPNNLEYYFISGAPFMDPEFYPDVYRVGRHQWTESDRNISQFMMKTFANFAKWGNPTQQQVEPIRVNWEPTTEGSFKYLSINNTFNTTMHFNYRQSETTFWYQYMPQVVREYIPTPPPPRNPWIDMKEPVTATMYGLIIVLVAFFVILCVCVGLWKSAKRQRNKALDDLSYYSNENLTLTKEQDYEVRNYFDKLNSLRQHNAPSRTGTLNTMITSDQTMQSRPVTPMISSNGRLSGHETMSEIDQYNQSPTKYQSQGRNMNQQTFASQGSQIEKPVIMELEEPSRVIRGHSQPMNLNRQDVSYHSDKQTFPNTQPTKGFSDPNIGLPAYQNRNYNTGPSTSSPVETRKSNAIPNSSYGYPLPPKSQVPQPMPRTISQPSQQTLRQSPQPVYAAQINQAGSTSPSPLPAVVEPQQPGTRPSTPTSAVKFEISMKPSKSVGTICSTTGQILNTDL